MIFLFLWLFTCYQWRVNTNSLKYVIKKLYNSRAASSVGVMYSFQQSKHREWLEEGGKKQKQKPSWVEGGWGAGLLYHVVCKYLLLLNLTFNFFSFSYSSRVFSEHNQLFIKNFSLVLTLHVSNIMFSQQQYSVVYL